MKNSSRTRLEILELWKMFKTRDFILDVSRLFRTSNCKFGMSTLPKNKKAKSLQLSFKFETFLKYIYKNLTFEKLGESGNNRRYSLPADILLAWNKLTCKSKTFARVDLTIWSIYSWWVVSELISDVIFTPTIFPNDPSWVFQNLMRLSWGAFFGCGGRFGTHKTNGIFEWLSFCFKIFIGEAVKGSQGFLLVD